MSRRMSKKFQCLEEQDQNSNVSKDKIKILICATIRQAF